MAVNYYDILSVNPDAPLPEIRDAIKEQRRLWIQRSNAPRLESRQEAERLLKLVPEIEQTLLNESARKEYDQLLLTRPQPKATTSTQAETADDLVSHGWCLIANGEIPDALSVATQATREAPDDADAWSLMGYARFRWGDGQDAIEDYRKALRIRPNDATLYYDLGSVYESLEMWAEAMQQYDRAASIDPSTAVYRAAKGSVFIKNEMFDEGIALLEQSLTEEPDNTSYKELLAIGFVESSYRDWTYLAEDDLWITSKLQHVQTAEELIQKARDLQVDDAGVKQRIDEIAKTCETARQRTFHGNWVAAATAGAVGVFAFFSGEQGILAGIFFLALAGLYVASCMTPRYRMNKRILENRGETTAPSIREEGCLATVFIGLLLLPFLPLMIIWNFVKNYLIKG